MGPVMRYLRNIRRPAGAIGFLSVGCVSLGVVAALAQTQPGEVPYLNYAPAVPVTPPRAQPVPPQLRPSNLPAAKDTTSAKEPGSNAQEPSGKEAGGLDALKQRDRELATLRE